VGAASSRDDASMAIERLFFAAGSRSYENLMISDEIWSFLDGSFLNVLPKLIGSRFRVLGSKVTIV
jgi:hypothetical protein